uniref:Lipase n=1 Tax=Strigamia maritima TaxID=126957 RepID=T1JGF3_STRMM
MNFLRLSFLSFIFIVGIQTSCSQDNTSSERQNPFNGLAKTINQYKNTIGNTVQNIKKLGYPVEDHQVQTQDGFILTIHRVRHNKVASGKPLLLLPGLSCSAMIFIRWTNSIGLFLADQGYDVWFGNSRGDIRYSKHIRYTFHDSEFWDFSWEELGYYDNSATIDYILNNTNYNQMILVTYSVATISSFALLSVNPEYNDKVATHVTLAPMTIVPYQTSVVMSLFMIHYDILQSWYNGLFDKAKFNHRIMNMVTMHFWPAMCLTFGHSFCKFAMALFLGYSPGSYDENIAVIAYDLSSGVSFKTFLHILQQIEYKEMRRYSYGEDENIKRYGTKIPPAFNMSQVTSPTVLISGINDPGSNPINSEMISRKMPQAKRIILDKTMFTHCDFVWSTDTEIRDYINQKILENINTVTLNPNNNNSGNFT